MKSEDEMRTIGLRLEQIRGRRSQKVMAAELGVALRSYAHYEHGTREVSAPVLQRLSLLGYDVNWVLTGKGSERAPAAADNVRELHPAGAVGRSQPARLDPEKLQFALEVVEEALAATGRTADPDGKAHLVAKIYETFLQEADVAKATATVLRLIRTGT